jgi:hypothetical protein
MKKGCFFTSLIILTILISVIIYIFKYHSPYVVNIFKPVIISSMRSDFDRRMKKIEKSSLNDSLKYIVNEYCDQLETAKQIEVSDAQFFFDSVRDIMHDGAIDSSEIKDMTFLLNKNRNQNERSAKNGN